MSIIPSFMTNTEDELITYWQNMQLQDYMEKYGKLKPRKTCEYNEFDEVVAVQKMSKPFIWGVHDMASDGMAEIDKYIVELIKNEGKKRVKSLRNAIHTGDKAKICELLASHARHAEQRTVKYIDSEDMTSTINIYENAIEMLLDEGKTATATLLKQHYDGSGYEVYIEGKRDRIKYGGPGLKIGKKITKKNKQFGWKF